MVVVPDGSVELGFFNRATVYRLRAVSLEDRRNAVWQCESDEEWKGTRLVFELEARKAATLARFTHSGWIKASEYFVSCNTTWGALMYRLKAAAEGKTPGPMFLTGGLAY